MVVEELTLESVAVGGQPLLRPFVERLRLRELLAEALGPVDRRLQLDPVDSLLLLVRNFALSRHPLYGVPDWVRQFDPAQVDLEPEQLRLVNDDRLGRALDRLFADLRRHRLLDRAAEVKTFWDPLSDVQRLVLELLEIPTSEYGQ